MEAVRPVRVCSRTLLLVSSVLTWTGCALPTTDRDGDGLADERELLLGTNPDEPDTDHDGLLDGEEILGGTSPLSRDSDLDGLPDGDDPTLDPPSERPGPISTGNDVEPNDDFATATALSPRRDDQLVLEGRVAVRGDVDVFAIGARSIGDRILVGFHPTETGRPATVAVFDARERLVALLHGRASGTAADVVGVTFRRNTTNVFLAVSHASDAVAPGSYRLDVSVEREEPLSVAAPQTLLLNFGGATLSMPILDARVIAPFDAGEVATEFAGQDLFFKQTIVETVRENFAAFSVEVRTSDDAEPLPASGVSTILFGSFSPRAFGASEGVDVLNTNRCDDGVVFTETFQPFAFGFAPSAEAVAVAMGNVASHEAGHLLGLSHVTDPTALMDELSPGVHLLSDQEFRRAPLAPSVFPIGLQDAELLLSETVGAR